MILIFRYSCLAILGASGDCGTLNNPSNGQVEVQGSGTGSFADYTCNTGFRIVGIAHRFCTGNGTWTGSSPTCHG